MLEKEDLEFRDDVMSRLTAPVAAPKDDAVERVLKAIDPYFEPMLMGTAPRASHAPVGAMVNGLHKIEDHLGKMDIEPLEGVNRTHTAIAAYLLMQAVQTLDDYEIADEFAELMDLNANPEGIVSHAGEMVDLSAAIDHDALARHIGQQAERDDAFLDGLRRMRNLIDRNSERIREFSLRGDGKEGSWSIWLIVTCSLSNVVCAVVAGVVLVIIAGVIIYRIARRRRRRR
ncbi:hypothetical protein [Notoacmeibacter sp. MSK16QG-6]|uniref:hypothetical protein n=1 Tax=Notoacmeibacter sp. MSK16QG-6 TaxID=2957982 RepID=UPI00209D9F4A|nr:hypothetical protein [Notoacmeibacter sp. MSK16QG-6]MCP1200946.1 hypothetical protein [Notoacmeibacter sp. MSK16QG-6]